MGDDNDLHEHLKNLIGKSSIRWTYAILWECSSQRQVLRFKDGYHRGSGNPKEIRIMGSCVSVAQHATDNDAATEWFFKISKGQSFEINDDLPGYALVALSPVWVTAVDKNTKYKWGMWERTKWARQFGIGTFLCIALKDKKVLELASTQIMPRYIKWIKHNVDLIHPIGTPSSPLDYIVKQLQQEQQQQQLFIAPQYQKLAQQNQQLRLRGKEPHQKHQLFIPEKLRTIYIFKKLLSKERSEEMKNRGKEKISDSKCSWTLLTESSDRGTERTFSCSHDYSGPS